MSSSAEARADNHHYHQQRQQQQPLVLPQSDIPIFTTVNGFREWRSKARREDKSVGFVPTMGALHDGHLSLVRKSLQENDYTVLSIFVNPAQFAPHEDLATYPRTLPRDLELLNAQSVQVQVEVGARASSPPLPLPPTPMTTTQIETTPRLNHDKPLPPTPPTTTTTTTTTTRTTRTTIITRTPSAVFAPTVSEMYPSGIVQDVSGQRGTFVEVKGYSHQMEGASRPTFFRGVATVVTKLFNVIEPTRAYFGQKDIQQALVLRRMAGDLLLAHPTPRNLRIVPTSRDPASGLALSSRNAYLSAHERRSAAPLLREALLVAKEGWECGALGKAECVRRAREWVEKRKEDVEAEAEAEVGGQAEGKAGETGAEVPVIKLDYIQMNDARTFEDVEDEDTMETRQKKLAERGEGEGEGEGRDTVILSGALWVNKTRLIDNIILGDKTFVFGEDVDERLL